MYKKILTIIVVLIWSLYAISQAEIMLNFTNINMPSLQDKVSLVHFTAPGNNFVGSFLRLPTKSIPDITIEVTGTGYTDTKICTKQVRGLYFNSQRGKRIWPLDTETLTLLKNQSSSYDNLSITWWLYTTCDSGNNYGIFGAITYTRWGKETYLVAGTKLHYTDNKIIADMANNFQYFDNKIPIGYIYDSNGGIGYVGGSLSGHENLINYLNNGGSIQSWFIYSWETILANNIGRETIIENGNSAMETMRNLIIQWSVGLSKSIEETERTSFLENVNEKTVIYNGNDINSSTVINFAKQKAQSLCQWKKINPVFIWSTDTVLCYENYNLTIDLASDDYNNKTIIVKSGNVILQGGMQENSSPLNLFIDKGILYLPAAISPAAFTINGFPGTPSVNEWLYIKGNLIINGLVLGNTGAGFTNKLHIQGKIIMLNTPVVPTPWRIDQIESMLGSDYNNFINLQNVFTRTCKLDGTSSDGSPCISDKVISTIPLVILNGNYPSSLLQ